MGASADNSMDAPDTKVPAAMITLTGAALQATGHTVIPVLAMGVGALVKLLLEVLLLPVAGVHICAAPISTLGCNLIVLLIEAVALSRALPFDFFKAKDLFRPLLCALLGVFSGGALYFTLLCFGVDGAWVMLPVLFVTVTVFALCALWMGAIGEEDLNALPAGDKLYRILKKCKWK